MANTTIPIIPASPPQYDHVQLTKNLDDIVRSIQQLSDATDEVFTDTEAGVVPASGGGIDTFLRADGTWAPPGGTAPTGWRRSAAGNGSSLAIAVPPFTGVVADLLVFENGVERFTDTYVVTNSTTITVLNTISGSNVEVMLAGGATGPEGPMGGTNQYTETELKALTPAANDVAFVAQGSRQDLYVFLTGNYSAQVAAGDARYLTTNADPTGAAGAWVLWRAVAAPGYSREQGARFTRNADRQFFGLASSFGGEFGYASGLNPLAQELHSWAFRDAGVLNSDVAGAMSIVGHAQSSNQVNWPGYPGAAAATIGVSGFAINDGSGGGGNGVAFGGYFDAVKFNSGITVAIETAIANTVAIPFNPNPFNMLVGGGSGGVGIWAQTGNGLDVAWYKHDLVQSVSAHQVMLSSFRPDGGTIPWFNNLAYVVGRQALDGSTPYVCLVAHTAPASGTFAAYRAANPSHWAVQKRGAYTLSTAYNVGDLALDAETGVTYRCLTAGTSPGSGSFRSHRASQPNAWRILPAARAGLVITNGAIEEISPGSDIFVVCMMPMRHQINWHRSDGTIGATVWATTTTQVNSVTIGDDALETSRGLKVGNTNITDATVLDHYLETSPTLGVTFGGGSTGLVISSQSCRATRVGDTVTLQGSLQLSAKGSSTGAASITGLPVSTAVAGASMSVGYYANLAGGNTMPPLGVVAGSAISLFKAGGTTAASMTDADFTDTTRLDFSLTYKV